jgi:hypothetical protein
MFNEKSIAGSALATLLAVAGATLPQAASADGQQQGVVVVRDPETGQFRAPTAAELRALRTKDTALLPQPKRERPPSSVRADGTRHLHLGDKGMVYSVARRDAEGKLVTQCVTGEHAAANAAPARDQEHDHEHD